MSTSPAEGERFVYTLDSEGHVYLAQVLEIGENGNYYRLLFDNLQIQILEKSFVGHFDWSQSYFHGCHAISPMPRDPPSPEFLEYTPLWQQQQEEETAIELLDNTLATLEQQQQRPLTEVSEHRRRTRFKAKVKQQRTKLFAWCCV